MQKPWLIALPVVLAMTAVAQQKVVPAAAQPAQQAVPQVPAEAPIVRRDPPLEAATALIGRPLFLRCFCSENNIAFDPNGRPTGAVKPTDWTVSAVNVQKAVRKSADALELDGVRVAISYNATAHEFQRHAQQDDKIHITVPDTGDVSALQRAFAAMFADGIDRSLQRSMPDYWQHYFDPQLAWPHDVLSGLPVYVPGDTGLMLGGSVPAPGAKAGPAVSSPEVAHKAAAQYTAFAQRDHVTGKTQMRFVVDAEGLPRQISIVQPQGYGLDERAVEAVMKMRFTPAMREGKPVAAVVLLNQDFEIVATPR